MTINELRDYLAKFTGEGKGDAVVRIANKEWNPLTESEDIVDAIFMEQKNGDAIVVLQSD
jgi:hypothetical protein